MKYKSFQYKSLDELKAEIEEQKLIIPLSENIDILRSSLRINGNVSNNRLAIQPMEGCDGTAEGSPDELTKRRYERFAASGAGLIWAEAVAVEHEGRANARQLMLTEKNLPEFQRLVESCKAICQKKHGFEPVVVMQATHSGRYSKPSGNAEPLIMSHNAHLEGENKLPESAIITDEKLSSLEETYAISAKLAEKAGFDGVDVKACHRYLISESFSAYERPGMYGGSFENRTRFFRNILSAVKTELSAKTFMTSRMNIYDGFPYPYGMGVLPEKGIEPQLAESIQIVKMLRDDFDMKLVNFTIGNPYSNPHVNRPFDAGPYEPPEHPLAGIARACSCFAEVKKAVPDIAVISSVVSYFRHFSAQLAAGHVESGCADMVGFGRQSFAYPDFAADIINNGSLDKTKCCITCSKCSQLMRAGSTAGCVVRDQIYLPVYKRDVLGNEKDISKMISNV